MKNKRGFTLIELLLAVFVLSVIISLSIPNFSKSFKRLELKRTAEDIVYLVRWAQSRAVHEGVEYKLVFIDDARSYQVLRGEVSEGQHSQNFSSISSHMGRVFKIPISVKVDDTQVVKIYPDGTLDKVRLRLQGQDENSLLISSMEQRGKMFILEENHES